ncbi:ribosomal-processing cysteine protease Prp [Gorillibacterium massiliense]|uniref:ribosomal-processing cysteine protease Prp n=1 Tax=Gorillibacterium massiliense TaxID=1280390 RepID=UPI0004AF6B0D|nr:ribosomal-processing cysteine protease Prp [Gorillibacterium massiliense]
MIRVRIERSKADRNILSFQVKGHASYADPGEDIVCAGVSAVTVGTVNAVEKLTGVVPVSRMKDGFLSARIPQDGDEGKRAEVQLLLESMVVMLISIEETYGAYIQVQDK